MKQKALRKSYLSYELDTSYCDCLSYDTGKGQINQGRKSQLTTWRSRTPMGWGKAKPALKRAGVG